MTTMPPSFTNTSPTTSLVSSPTKKPASSDEKADAKWTHLLIVRAKHAMPRLKQMLSGPSRVLFDDNNDTEESMLIQWQLDYEAADLVIYQCKCRWDSRYLCLAVQKLMRGAGLARGTWNLSQHLLR